ncbi:recombinase family protein [Streptosporangium sp. NPDC002524]|uniref:recombinase family protein n=1 Tax=Streptosporangium sp. NPDC002524 TaxID=3154537 RepID=UPI00332AA437
MATKTPFNLLHHPPNTCRSRALGYIRIAEDALPWEVTGLRDRIAEYAANERLQLLGVLVERTGTGTPAFAELVEALKKYDAGTVIVLSSEHLAQSHGLRQTLVDLLAEQADALVPPFSPDEPQSSLPPSRPPAEAAISDATAEGHDKALAVVQRLLKTKEIHAYTVHTIALKLGQDGTPWPLGQRTRRPPELVAHSREGWEVATVTVGLRSGFFVVSLPSVGVTAQLVNADQPHAVVDLILAALPKEAA